MDETRIREKVELLTGERGAPGKPMGALRRGELLALAGRRLLSEQVTAAPTMDQHNALQADVAFLLAALAKLAKGQ